MSAIAKDTTMAAQHIEQSYTVTQLVIGEFHPYLTFLPILFFTLALFGDLFNQFGKRRGFSFANWCVILGCISCIPTVLTGIYAADFYDAKNVFLHKHTTLGYATAVSASLYAGLRISAMIWQLPLLPSHYVWLSILMLALVSWTSDYGLLINVDVQAVPALDELERVK